MKHIFALLILLATAACSGASENKAPHVDYAIFLAPGGGKAVLEKRMALIQSIVEKASAGDSITLLDGLTINTLYKPLELPKNINAASVKSFFLNRKGYIEEKIKPLFASEGGGHLNLPAIVRRLMDMRKEHPDRRIVAALVGPVAFFDAASGKTYTTLSDSALCDPSSSFHTDKSGHLKGTEVCYMATDDRTECELKSLERFYALYFIGRGAKFRLTGETSSGALLHAPMVADSAYTIDCQHPATPTCGPYQFEEPKKKAAPVKTTSIRKASSSKKAAPKHAITKEAKPAEVENGHEPKSECLPTPQEGAE